MRVRSLLETALVVGACLASGTLECEPPPQTAAQHRGRELYGRMCAVCHGRRGEGYAADQAPALAGPEFLGSVTDKYLRAAIADGRRGTTMSAWSVERGGPLPSVDLDALLSFLRTWDRGPRVGLDEKPAVGNASQGADVFARECLGCHGSRGIGGPQVHVGNPDLLAAASEGFLRYAIARGRRGTPMPGFDGRLGAAGVEDVLALLRSWQRSAGPPAPPARAAPIPLGPVPLHPRGPEPVGFNAHPALTGVDVVHGQLERGARLALLDARAPSDYLAGHIAGAVSVPFYDPDPYVGELPRDAWLICYCACPHAESGQLARSLATKGFTKVTVLDEGFNVWKARGFPTRSGSDP